MGAVLRVFGLPLLRTLYILFYKEMHIILMYFSNPKLE